MEVTGPEQVGWGVQARFADPDGNGFRSHAFIRMVAALDAV